MRLLSPADDDLHEPTSDDLFWTETAWFACSVPELNLTAHFYPVFRTNQNICSSGMFVWDDGCTYSHDALYSHIYWHLPLPRSLVGMRLPSGLAYDVIEPLRRYRVRYDSEEFSADLVFAGLTDPVLAPKQDHLDQPCRVEGWMEIHGDRVDVAGFEMRDKSWHVRSDKPLRLPDDIAKGSYTYAIRDDFAFLARTTGASALRTDVQGGWLWRDGVVASLQSGSRTVERSGSGIGDRITIEGLDERGRSFVATGTTVNHFAYQSTPAIPAWLRGTLWQVDGGDAWGEDQEWAAGHAPKRLAAKQRRDAAKA